MNCTDTRWIGGWGIPSQTFIKNYTIKVVKNAQSCFNQCLSMGQCYSFSNAINSPNVCTLYSKEIDRLQPLYNDSLYEYGTKACCANVGIPRRGVTPCFECSNCSKVLNCSQIIYVWRLGIPDDQFIVDYTIKDVNTTRSCVDECELTPNCFTFTYSGVSSI
ncbi:hypothetical protein MN116_005476 [Schistosoma mekongi]|uniref:Apple domain-containing protein n=1 Tax=Schistosoma mekongi TaxID=38744 RepID=A0AAE2D5N8_SCHME|nr:hypothetical protein MN116_005476 [Schistosoma mekongi]